MSSRLLLGRCVWIDALFGTGLARPLEGVVGEWIERLESARGPKLAVDLPSGLDADTGSVLGCAAAVDITVTFGALKPGLLRGEGPRLAGRVVIESLGLPFSARP